MPYRTKDAPSLSGDTSIHILPDSFLSVCYCVCVSTKIVLEGEAFHGTSEISCKYKFALSFIDHRYNTHINHECIWAYGFFNVYVLYNNYMKDDMIQKYLLGVCDSGVGGDPVATEEERRWQDKNDPRTNYPALAADK
jgi:hypothetical protein